MLEVKFRFTCGTSDLKHSKVVKYCDQDYLNFCLFCALSMTTQVFRKKVSSVKNLPTSKVESFVKSNLHLNQTCTIVFTQNHSIRTLGQMNCLIFLTKT